MEQLIKTTTAMMTDAMVAEDGTTNGDMVMSLARILMGEMKTLQKSFTEAQIASLLRAEDVVLIQEMLDETMRKYVSVVSRMCDAVMCDVRDVRYVRCSVVMCDDSMSHSVMGCDVYYIIYIYICIYLHTHLFVFPFIPFLDYICACMLLMFHKVTTK